MEQLGLIISGENVELNLVEMIEIKNHPWFVGVQFHPESIVTEHGMKMVKNFLEV